MLMRADLSVLFVVDVQERLLPAMADPGAVEAGERRHGRPDPLRVVLGDEERHAQAPRAAHEPRHAGLDGAGVGHGREQAFLYVDDEQDREIRAHQHAAGS
jgi:hypothetical protein